MMLAGHPAWFAARAGFLALGALLPPLTAALSYSLASRRDQAMTAGLLAVFSGFYAPYLPVTDTFGLTMLLGALFWLVAGGGGRMADGAWHMANGKLPMANCHSPIVNRKSKVVNRKSLIVNSLLPGLLAGLMHLTRADGMLWLLPAILVVCNERATFDKKIAFYVLRITACLGGYLLVMTPWLARNMLAFGAPLAPGGARALWLTHYDQLFAYPASSLTFASWWNSGLASILEARLWAAGVNLASALTVQGGIFLLPFILIGLWQLRREARVRPALLAWILTFAVMTLVFPFAGARGGFFHSGAALQPFWWAVAPLGLGRVVEWGARRRGWAESRARAIFLAGLVGLAALLTALIVRGRVIGSFNGEQAWAREAAAYRQVEEFLRAQGAAEAAVVIVANPPGYYLASGRPAIAVPDGDAQAVRAVAERYGGRYLILEKDSLPGGLVALYDHPEGRQDFRYLGEAGAARLYAIQP
jgi:hypothetical protein